MRPLVLFLTILMVDQLNTQVVPTEPSIDICGKTETGFLWEKKPNAISYDENQRKFYVYISHNEKIHVWSATLNNSLPIRTYQGTIPFEDDFVTVTRTPKTTIVWLATSTCVHENHANLTGCTKVDYLSPPAIGHYAVSYYGRHEWRAYQTTDSRDIHRYTSGFNESVKVVEVEKQLVKSMAIYEETADHLKAVVTFGKVWGHHQVKFEPLISPSQSVYYISTGTWFGCPQSMCVDAYLDATSRNNNTGELYYFRGLHFWISHAQGTQLDGPHPHSYKVHLSAAFVLNNQTYAIANEQTLLPNANKQSTRDMFPGLKLKTIEAAAGDGNLIHLFSNTAMSVFEYHKSNNTFTQVPGSEHVLLRSRYFGVPNQIDAAFVSHRQGKAVLYLLTGAGFYRSWLITGGRPRNDDPTKLAPGQGWPCEGTTYSSHFGQIGIEDLGAFKKYRLDLSVSNKVFDDSYTELLTTPVSTISTTNPDGTPGKFGKSTLAIIIVLALLTAGVFAAIIWICCSRYRERKKKRSTDSEKDRRYLDGDATIKTDQESKSVSVTPTLVEVQPTLEFTPRLNNVQQTKSTVSDTKSVRSSSTLPPATKANVPKK